MNRAACGDLISLPGAVLPGRWKKRRRTGAVQNASRISGFVEPRATSWTAPVLWRFGRPKNPRDWRMTSDAPVSIYGGLTKTVAAPESRLDDSARFWTAAALCRFFTGRRATQNGGGPPQSTTLTRNSFARNRLGGRRIFETAPD